jgi:CO/xanthine dehydrogenase Mo-binding subunit
MLHRETSRHGLQVQNVRQLSGIPGRLRKNWPFATTASEMRQPFVIEYDMIATGRGIGLGTHHVPLNQGDRITFAAAVVEIKVNKDTSAVVAKHIYGAMDCGLAVNPRSSSVRLSACPFTAQVWR